MKDLSRARSWQRDRGQCWGHWLRPCMARSENDVCDQVGLGRERSDCRHQGRRIV